MGFSTHSASVLHCIYTFVWRILHACIHTYIHSYINTNIHTSIHTNIIHIIIQYLHNIYLHVGPGGALVETTSFDWRVVGSNPVLDASQSINHSINQCFLLTEEKKHIHTLTEPRKRK